VWISLLSTFWILVMYFHFLDKCYWQMQYFQWAQT
jgi:hypothetical protein